MAKKNLTDITMVLDRSGSMNEIKSDTIGGFNQFLNDQKKVEGKATFTLVQFDDEYEVIHQGINIQDVPDLTNETFVPRSMTRLFDAIGKTIVITGEHLDKMNEEDKPSKVIFVILTDGKENASQEYRDTAEIFNMVKHHTEKYSWEFVFLGAKQDAIAVGTSLGIKAGSSLQYGKTGDGTIKAFASLSTGMSMYRSVGLASNQSYFNNRDREEQEEEIAKEN
jgi:hypothetical protein